MNFECPEHGQIEPEIRSKGPHLGVYCPKCGKWIKWISKSDYTKYVKKNVSVEEYFPNVSVKKNVSVEEYFPNVSVEEYFPNVYPDEECPF